MAMPPWCVEERPLGGSTVTGVSRPADASREAGDTHALESRERPRIRERHAGREPVRTEQDCPHRAGRLVGDDQRSTRCEHERTGEIERRPPVRTVKAARLAGPRDRAQLAVGMSCTI